MNMLQAVAPGIIGNEEAKNAFEATRSAKLLLVSDTHGSSLALASLILEFGRHVDALLFAGDGADDILRYCVEACYTDVLKQALPPLVFLVSGNCDFGQYSLPGISPSFIVPKNQKITVSGTSIFLTHGDKYSVDFGTLLLTEAGKNMQCSVAVHGHTHVQRKIDENNFLIVNPGSLERPRGRSKAGFAIMDVYQGLSPSVSFYAAQKGVGNKSQYIQINL
ncbi:YfcE family phosphodiesterase [Treponema phagedenis]|uniref:Phosphoesterase n=2 Tax=Treponema phagedenis TaxID=162 RepID=A0A0B7H294_TREPH|nr:YfcE family phosphodiesterase [Treponema phagedenis]QEJ94025.1 YfcE family phosphodiesterase [Treponema phagedenis]QEJ97177.1 YfcE family phosphodiesterase [Treponema phagedenis]QEK01967.1 YfcE family phosphodiesterase [Treponema phagedenis]QEK02633.1 YfcE family phosphodiesterase [Treponema phagedenis]